jgi:hypothetical protein
VIDSWGECTDNGLSAVDAKWHCFFRARGKIRKQGDRIGPISLLWRIERENDVNIPTLFWGFFKQNNVCIKFGFGDILGDFFTQNIRSPCKEEMSALISRRSVYSRNFGGL